MAEAVFFWIFATILVGSAFAVIFARNPVHSVLFLILAFVCAAGLFLILGAEFLAMILIIVYVGAVAVLFLFVVMLLDVDFARMKQGFVQYLPQGLFIAALVFLELWYVMWNWGASPSAAAASTPSGTLSNTAALGEVLYTRYLYYFQAAGMILQMPTRERTLRSSTAVSGVRATWAPTSWRLTPALCCSVRTMAPIIAVSRIIPAAWK